MPGVAQAVIAARRACPSCGSRHQSGCSRHAQQRYARVAASGGGVDIAAATAGIICLRIMPTGHGPRLLLIFVRLVVGVRQERRLLGVRSARV